METIPMMRRLFLAVAMTCCGGVAVAESPPSVDPVAVLIEGGPALQNVDLGAAEKIFQKSCRACHGNKGQGASSYPRISDKEPEYLADRLVRYRQGEKFGPNSVLMIQSAKRLSDEDIVNLSVYVATAFD